MKKKMWVLAIFLLIPCIVFADASGPSILGYDAVVINPDGIEVNNGDNLIKIPYDTKIHVIDEYSDEAYFDVLCENSNDNCYSGTVKLKDIIPIKEEIIPTAKDANDENSPIFSESSNIIVLEKSGIKLSKGPAGAYSTYSETIPYKTNLKSKYVVVSYSEHSSIHTWYYIDDGNYKGWVSTVGDKYKVAYNSKDIVAFKDIKMYDENDKVIETIPSETIIRNVYNVTKADKYGYYLNYKNYEGYISYSNWSSLYDKVAIVGKSFNITTSTGKTIANIKAGDVVKVYGDIYTDDEKTCYYVEYNNVKGFITVSYYADIATIEKNELKKSLIEVNQDSKLYAFGIGPEGYYASDDDIRTTIPKGEKINAYLLYNYDGTKYYLVYYNNNVGFVKASHTSVAKEEVNNTTIDEKENLESKDDDVIQKNNDNEKPSDNKTVDIKKKSDNIMLYSIIVSVMLCIITVLLIIIVNMKKKLNTTKDNKIPEKLEKNEKITEKENNQ